MIIDTPTVFPVTTVVLLAVVPGAASPLLLLHVPPNVVLLNDVVNPWHTFITPVIAAGLALMVTVAVALHPVPGIVAVIISVVPPVTPVTVVVELPVVTVALPLPAVQFTPAVVVLREVVKPTHTASTPVIGAGFGLMVTVAVARHPVAGIVAVIRSVVLPFTPVTTVVELPVVTVALPLAAVQLTPAVVVLKDVVKPTHTASTPVIGAGFGLIVTVAVARHPVAGMVAVMMSVVLPFTPVTVVVELPVVIVALPLPAVQFTPAVVVLKDVVKPTHTASTPVIGAGFGLIVTVAEARHPVAGIVAVMMSVVLPFTPVTVVVELPVVTVALPFPAVQLTPAVVVLNVVVKPTHTASTPVIGAGFALMVTVAEARQPVAGIVAVIISVVPPVTPVTVVVDPPVVV